MKRTRDGDIFEILVVVVDVGLESDNREQMVFPSFLSEWDNGLLERDS